MSHIKRGLRMAICAVLALTFLVTAPLSNLSQPVQAATIDELNNKYSQLENQIQAGRDKINSIKDENERLQAEKAQLDTEIAALRDQISILQQKINSLDGEIAQKEQEINEKLVEIDNTEQQLYKRMRAQYISGDTSFLDVLLSSGSITEMLINFDSMSKVAEHDQNLISQLQQQKKDLENQKASLGQQRADQESSRATIAAKKTELDARSAGLASTISDNTYDQNMTQDQIKKYIAEQNRIDQQIADILKSHENGGNNNDNQYTGGLFTWPVPGYYNTIPYGYSAQYLPGVFHTGIDINRGSQASIQGARIVAAADGTVAFVGYEAGGYGNYFMIDHGYQNGQKLYTLYGHCQSVAVVAGQKVSRGQTVAYVGTTGNSTGYHLHFEVRTSSSYGSHVNPMNYLKK